jgi:hypothetical protein
MHPWLKLAWQHPERVAEHLAAYAALAADEAALALDHALARGRRQLLIAACGVVAATLAGTALLLWVALPAPAAGRGWWLVVVPLWPLAVAAMAWRWQPPAAALTDFVGLRAQLSIDRGAWEGGASADGAAPAPERPR